jgi:hypothetical protein
MYLVTKFLIMVLHVKMKRVIHDHSQVYSAKRSLQNNTSKNKKTTLIYLYNMILFGYLTKNWMIRLTPGLNIEHIMAYILFKEI